MYVADTNNNRVEVFAPTLATVTSTPTPSSTTTTTGTATEDANRDRLRHANGVQYCEPNRHPVGYNFTDPYCDANPNAANADANRNGDAKNARIPNPDLNIHPFPATDPNRHSKKWRTGTV